MKQLIKDILGFTKSLSNVDLLLYFAVLVLIILVVSLIYIIKTSDEEEEKTSEIVKNDNEDIDLKEIVTTLENTEPSQTEITSYENEQEEKAIISYDELLKRSKSGAINYEEEVENKEISIKKISLDTLVEAPKEETPKTDSLFNYEKEEAFLKTLKALNELLN